MSARTTPALALILALAVLAAGCATPASEAPAPTDPGAAPFVDPLIEKHNHSDPLEHQLATDNVKLLGWSSLGDDANATRGTYGELDIVGDRAYVAVLGDGGETPGFVIVNVSDPANPRMVSFTASPGTRIADIKGEPQNKFLFVAGETGLTPSQGRITRLLGGGPEGAMGFLTRNGVRVYDVTDPEHPTLLNYGPSDSGCHMVYFKVINEQEYLFCVGVAINIYAFNRDDGSLTLAGRFQPTDAQGNLEVVQQSGPTGPIGEATPHDMTLQDDTLTGRILMYVSYWDLGLRIVDVSNPAMPEEVGAWRGADALSWAGNVHTAMATNTDDGRRLVYVIPELFTGEDVPALYILDATDLTAPTLVGEWAAPGNHPNDGIRFSMHNFQIVNGRLYLAYYHGGAWILDVSGEHAGAPEILGYYLPHQQVQTWLPPEGELNVPDVWDLVLKDGYLYATCINTGLYVLHYEGDTLGDPTATSFA